jgi:hypothetical protein
LKIKRKIIKNKTGLNKTIFLSMMAQEKIIKIKLAKEDFLEINIFVLHQRRPKLSSDFADYISLKIQDYDVKCWLRNAFNYISCKQSIFNF